MRVTNTKILPYPVEKVAKVLHDRDFQIALEKLREGVISCEFHPIQERENEILFEMRTVEYKRKKTGGLDKSGRVDTVTKLRYDALEQRLHWQYFGEGGKMFQLKGIYSLSPSGEETRFTHDVDIEVRIPLIGKKIAQMIAKDFENEDPRYENLWKEFLEKA